MAVELKVRGAQEGATFAIAFGDLLRGPNVFDRLGALLTTLDDQGYELIFADFEIHPQLLAYIEVLFIWKKKPWWKLW